MLKQFSQNSEKPYDLEFIEPSVLEENSTSKNVGSEKKAEYIPQKYEDINLIGGKFKSPQELSKAYIELQRRFGIQAKELGELRKIAQEYENHLERCRESKRQLDEFQNLVKNIDEKYNTDNYLKNREFREILKTAYDGFGNKLDVDTLVKLIDNYHNSRLAQAKKAEAILSESDNATDLLAYSSDNAAKFKSKKKKLTDMTPEELDKALDELM